MNRKNRRKGGISTIIITLVLVAIVLATIPSLKAITNSNASAAKNISDDIINVTK